jgi:hypothetical protein
LPDPSKSRSKKSKRSSGSPELPEVFLDRSLGSLAIAVELRKVGYTVHTMRAVYSEKTSQRVADEKWLKKCGKANWVAFSKDQGLRDPRTSEHRALVKWKVRAFILSNAKMKEKVQIARFVKNRNRIAMKCRQPGPFVAVVYKDSVEFSLRPPSRGRGTETVQSPHGGS